MVEVKGIEPSTTALSELCSAIELHLNENGPFGGIRTRPLTLEALRAIH
jgi:hypothetical protein